MTYRLCFFSCSSGYVLLSELQVHIAGSCPGFFFHQYIQILLLRGSSQSISLPVCADIGVCAPAAGVHDLALGLVMLHEVHMGLPLELVKVPLDGILSLRQVNSMTQLGVICKLAEGAFPQSHCVVYEGSKQHWSWYGPQRDTTHYCFPFGY